MGMKPVYANGDSLYNIINIDTQLIVNAGNIYTWNNYLFLNEINKGIHVIDKSDINNPYKITFIKIVGNKNYTINDSTLYADNGRDLIAIDIRDILHVRVLNIVKGGLVNNNNFPPNYEGTFECFDASKGIVIEWKEELLINPKCRK